MNNDTVDYVNGVPSKKVTKKPDAFSGVFGLGYRHGLLRAKEDKIEEDSKLVQLEKLKADILTEQLQQNQMALQNILTMLQVQQSAQAAAQSAMPPLPGMGSPDAISGGLQPLPGMSPAGGGMPSAVPPLPNVGEPRGNPFGGGMPSGGMPPGGGNPFW